MTRFDEAGTRHDQIRHQRQDHQHPGNPRRRSAARAAASFAAFRWSGDSIVAIRHYILSGLGPLCFRNEPALRSPPDVVFHFYTVITGLFNSNQTRSSFKNRDAPSVFASPLPSSQYIISVIDTDAKLAAFLPTFKSATWLALDTEADSLHAYPEKVCLIQISTAAGDRID